MYALLLTAQHTNTAFWLACLNSSAHEVYCCYDERHRLSWSLHTICRIDAMKILALHLLYHQRSVHLLPIRRFGSVHIVITDDAAVFCIDAAVAASVFAAV